MGKGRQPELIKDISMVLGLHSKELAEHKILINDIIKVLKEQEELILFLSKKLQQLVKENTK